MILYISNSISAVFLVSAYIKGVILFFYKSELGLHTFSVKQININT